MRTIPVCVQCKFYSSIHYMIGPKCNRPIQKPLDLVTGENSVPLRSDPQCERSAPGFWGKQDRCGPEGRYYEPIEHGETATLSNLIRDVPPKDVPTPNKPFRVKQSN